MPIIMQLKYQVVDVFTKTRFGGNPLAVVLSADELTGAQMQVIAKEFNFSETSFVCRPKDVSNTAHVRIFTPNSEMDFAGHPNVGTAYVLAKNAGDRPTQFRFEERVGIVPITVEYDDMDNVQSTAIMSPQSLKIGEEFDPVATARALSIDASDIQTNGHHPTHVSVGANIIVVELKTRDALAKLNINSDAALKLVPSHDPKAPKAIYAYYRGDEELDWTARMFTFRGTAYEDPATGSAGGAMAAFAHHLDIAPKNGGTYKVTQGIDMGRPSAMQLKIIHQKDGAKVQISGACVDVMKGKLLV
jgi:trans-2,3-dihydro-3-hydroxyanthranilate isomerase